MDCIYLAAGNGVRMKEPVPKQFLTLLGRPIIVYALEVLERSVPIDTIYVAYHRQHKAFYEKVLRDYSISKCVLVEGGATRQESVWRALEKVGSDRVMVHEAARPFITEGFVEYLAGFDDDGVIPTIPIPFTVSEGGEFMERQLQRDRLHNIQLPQTFDTAALRDAHRKAQAEDFIATEDGILLFRTGRKVRFVEGLENNLKITTPLDLIVAEHFMEGTQR